MLAIQKQSKYIQKTVQLPNGSWAVLVFELVERDGHIIAKAVSGKLVSEKPAAATSFGEAREDVLCLPYIKSPAEFVPVRYFTSEIIHSFLKDLSFVMSQPTRAPATI